MIDWLVDQNVKS